MTRGDAFSFPADAARSGIAAGRVRWRTPAGLLALVCRPAHSGRASSRSTDRPAKPGYRLKAGDVVTGLHSAPAAVPGFCPNPSRSPSSTKTRDIVVINKPPGLVVHPAPGHCSGTLVNALLYHCPDLGGIGAELRPGIVHRLDKDTSGTLVVAKNGAALEHLAAQFKARTVRKDLPGAGPRRDARRRSGTDPAAHRPAPRGPQAHVDRAAARARQAETGWRVRGRLGGFTPARTAT
ncbi:MAG: pseudouridine synthase [Desulfobacterales bacterium]|nr:pseudouridine synthase [Desulfobacterales bacterium]